MSTVLSEHALTVDHRYSPPWWQTLICLPDDPVKTLVGREGQFFLDYGSGGPRNFQTSIQFDLLEGAEWVSQELPDAGIPVLVTRKAGGVTVEETTFLVPPDTDEPAPRVVRYDGFETLQNWAAPRIECDPTFRSAAVRYPSGSHEASLEVHLHIEPHGERTVALGFCEGVHTNPGKRRLVALVEGAETREIDPVRDFGPNMPGVQLFSARDTDGDGRIIISLKFHPDTRFDHVADRVSDLRTIMLSALWAFAGPAPSSEEIASGEASASADVYAPGRDLLLPHRRNYLIARLENPEGAAVVTHPVLRIAGLREPVIDGDKLKIGPHDLLTCSSGFRAVREEAGDVRDVRVEAAGIEGTGGREWVVDLGEIRLAAGENRAVVVVLDRFPRDSEAGFADVDRAGRAAAQSANRNVLPDGTASQHVNSNVEPQDDRACGSTMDPIPGLFLEAESSVGKARAWWRATGPGQHIIEVPDDGVQRLVDSCVRNIFQARDIRNGLPSFHVGPTIYRGLFLADGAFMLELAAMLDLVADARAGIAYLKGFELPDGGFNVIDTYYKENGIAIFALVRHARLTNDRDWLRSNWETVRGCVRRIQRLRSSVPADAANAGLLPTGAFCDGGVFNNGRPFADYSNVVWCLSGLRWAAEAASWLGETHDARDFEAEFDDFWSPFRRSAERDLTPDGKGNMYLPVVQGNGDSHAPARGQWAFCHSVYPGGIFAGDDPIALGTLAMLRDAMVEGVVLDTGWMAGGLWPYFSSFLAHALLWVGRGEEVPQILYDFANHSSPTLVWREEQKPQGQGYEEVGDMPHNWASTEFLRMVVHMLELDRGDELHLLEGFPADWAAPGLTTRLRGVRTPFGRIDLEVEGQTSGVRVNLEFERDANFPRRIVIHRKSWGGEGEIELPNELSICQFVPRR